MAFDFPNASPPTLEPLRRSFAVDEVEAELKQLFIDLFEAYLGTDVFDANVLGMAHLGSFDLVKRSVNADGLVLLAGEREEPATRYVYRAWKSRNTQGRGLFFLRTYLQALFPGAWDIQQQMQDKTLPYPTALYDQSFAGDDSDKFLTSRVHVKFDATVVSDVTQITPIVSAIVPARILPKLMIVLSSETGMRFGSFGNPAITLRGEGEVLPAPTNPMPDASMRFGSFGNPAITLRGSGSVYR